MFFWFRKRKEEKYQLVPLIYASIALTRDRTLNLGVSDTLTNLTTWSGLVFLIISSYSSKRGGLLAFGSETHWGQDWPLSFPTNP